MKKRLAFILSAFAALSAVSGCGNNNAADTTTSAATTAAATTEATTTEAVTQASVQEKSANEQAEEIVAGMTLEQKIAQMITVSMRQWSDNPDDPDSFADVTELNEQQKRF